MPIYRLQEVGCLVLELVTAIDLEGTVETAIAEQGVIVETGSRSGSEAGQETAMTKTDLVVPLGMIVVLLGTIVVLLGMIVVLLGTIVVLLGTIVVLLGMIVLLLGMIVVPLGMLVVPLGMIVVPLGMIVVDLETPQERIARLEI